MCYVLEKITEEVGDRIIKDLQDLNMKNDLFFVLRHKNEGYFNGEYTGRWVVDYQNDSYLLYAPFLITGHSPDQNFIFYYHNQIYWLTRSLGIVTPFPIPVTEPTWSGKIWFNERSSEAIKHLIAEQLIELKLAIKKAFSVYGEFGKGNEKYPYMAFFVDEIEELSQKNEQN